MNASSMLSHASPVVIFIVLGLIGVSILSWAITFWSYSFNLKEAKRAKVLEEVVEAKVIDDIAKTIDERYFTDRTFSVLFWKVRKELSRGRKLSLSESMAKHQVIMETIRNFSETYEKKLSRGKNIQATMATLAPYVGLVGTVWGILNAFVAMGEVSNVSFTELAPAIGEALIATAIGLVAAISASFGQNVITSFSEDSTDVFKNSSERFLNAYTLSRVNESRGHEE
ncbi:MotA/TolQ/ExbB proton channel family protein [Vibrio fortis]|uniref:MotA/TolQ/ExbB proton channel family protein n=1 Tax=Vibrio fortis TaxID=212667 RepID=UPI0040689DFB